MKDGEKVIKDVQILSDNVNIEDISKHSKYTTEQLKEYNLLESDIVNKDFIIQEPESIEYIDGGYDKITQYNSPDGSSIFVVPNQDGTTTTYGTFTDNFEKKVA